MSRKLASVFFVSLLLVMLDISVLAQSPADSSYIFRIEASECKNDPTVRRQTGFLIGENNGTGIVTALHGVADCPDIRAIGIESEFSKLQIIKVDIKRDVALLWSERAESVATGGLRIEADLEAVEGDGVYTVGYPVNLDAQLPTRQMTLRGGTQLIKLVPDDLVKPLYDRKSPDLGIQVLSIEGHLLPGHSGAPIFNEDNRLIGVGNGGLDSGRIGISWAVPWREIDWKPVLPGTVDNVSPEVVEKLDSLQESSVLFFSFVSSDPPREELVEKTVCKSILNANYESINELKDELLMMAKRQIVGELFGEFLMAYNQSEDSGLSGDQFTKLTAGYVRTAGDPTYKNHEARLGEVCVSVEGFVTPKDKRKLEPIQIESDEVCVTENLPSLELKRIAEDRAVIRALVNYDSNLEGQDKDKLLRLMKNIDFAGSGYDAKTGAYCAIVKGEVLPIEIINLTEVDVSLETVNLQTEAPWWDANYSSRVQLAVKNQTDAPLPLGYTVRLKIGGEEAKDLFSKSTSIQPGDDVRIVYWNQSEWQEIDRIIETFTSSQVELWFSTQADIPPNGMSEHYWIYFDNTDATDPSANGSKVFLWWDDFSSNTISKYTVWRVNKEGIWQRGTVSYDDNDKRLSVATGDDIWVFIQPPISGQNLIIEGDLYLVKTFPDSGKYQALTRMVDANNWYAASFPVSVYDVYMAKGFEVKTIEMANGGKMEFPLDTWHHIAMSAYKDRIEAWLNDIQIAFNDEEHKEGGVGIGMYQADGFVDNIRVRKYVIPEPSVSISD